METCSPIAVEEIYTNAGEIQDHVKLFSHQDILEIDVCVGEDLVENWMLVHSTLDGDGCWNMFSTATDVVPVIADRSESTVWRFETFNDALEFATNLIKLHSPMS